jgi:hypothetical protein
MNPDQENFESLQKLLSLKRHEQPPPGYFRSFSNNVMARINASEGDAEGLWLLRLWRGLLARPLLSGAVGAGAFGLLVFGVVFSQSNTPGGSASFMLQGAPFAATAPGLDKPSGEVFFNHFARSSPEEINSTNPVTTAKPPSLFTPASLNLEKVNYPGPGN